MRWMRHRVLLTAVFVLALGLLIAGLTLRMSEQLEQARGPDSGVLGLEKEGPTPRAKTERAPGPHKLRDVARLGKDARLKVIADVQEVTAQWNADQTAIETTAHLGVVETLDGNAPNEVLVTQPGGQVGDLGLAVSHVAEWQPGERALVLLEERNGRYRVVGGDKGKFRVKDRQVPELNMSVDDVVRVAQTGQVSEDLTLAAATATPDDGVAQFSSDFALTAYRWSASSLPIEYKINPANTPPGVDPTAFVNGTNAALATWMNRSSHVISWRYGGTTTVAANGHDGVNAVFWAPIPDPGVLGRALCWYIPSSGTALDCDVVFDPSDFVWNSQTQITPDAVDFESVALHEFGHFLGLSHSTDPTAIMFASLNFGSVKRTPNDDDLAGVTTIYGAGASAPASEGNQRVLLPFLTSQR